jgi:hypothetical protein
MKSAFFSGVMVMAIVVCCGNCSCCSCGDSGPVSWVTEGVQDRVKEEIAEMVVEEGAELLLENAFGEGSTVELDSDNRHAYIEKDGYTADIWVKPDQLPKGSKWPTADRFTYVYTVNAKSVAPADGSEGKVRPGRGEIAGVEYAAEDREAVVAAFTKWLEGQGFTVENLLEIPEDGSMDVPGLDQFGVDKTELALNGMAYLKITGLNTEGAAIFGPVYGQIWFEELEPASDSAFWWKE